MRVVINQEISASIQPLVCRPQHMEPRQEYDEDGSDDSDKRRMRGRTHHASVTK